VDDRSDTLAGISVNKIRDVVFIITTIIALVAGWYTMKNQIDMISSQLKVVERDLTEASDIMKELSSRAVDNDARIRILEREIENKVR